MLFSFRFLFLARKGDRHFFAGIGPITVRGNGNAVQHEASVSKLNAEQIFYMRQRGLTEADAVSLSVNGFVNDLIREFPMEYSVELKRLIDMEMEDSVD